MANSLQDQLLKAGLVSEEQLRAATKPPPRARAGAKGTAKRRKRPDRARGGKGSAGHQPTRANRDAKAPPANPTLEELNAKIRKLLDENRQNAEDAEVPYNFMRDNRIKKLYVTEAQRQSLLAGELAIAGYRRVHHIIPAAVANEIQSLREEIYVHRAGDANTASDADASAAEPADEEHAIPDDLVW